MAKKFFLLTMPDEMGIYLALALCGLSIILLALHVQRKFVRASAVLTELSREWEDAQTQFLKIADTAREQLGNLNAPRQSQGQSVKPPEGPVEVSFGLRNQVTAMAKSGASPDEIGRAAGLTEAEVNVLLGMSRVRHRKK